VTARPAAPPTSERSRRRRPRRPAVLAVLGWGVLAAIVAVGQLLDPARDDETDVEMPAVTVVGEVEHAPVHVVAAPAPAPTPAKPRTLPRPFEAMRRFASPLIMPRLHLPRVLTPRFAGLSRLLGRARPGEPVAVTLTAYCLQGTTRRGREVRPGIIAADPRIFPLARHVELFAGGRFLGRFLVDDTGAHVRGTRIDIWTPDCDDARRFGTRPGIATLVARDGN
jgi:3D (Asp-Asp-Asp) domain-containing protein